MDDLVKEYSDFLRDRLLSDNYGGWRNLDPTFLQNLCDRMALEREAFIEETSCDETKPDYSIFKKGQNSFTNIRL